MSSINSCLRNVLSIWLTRRLLLFLRKTESSSFAGRSMYSVILKMFLCVSQRLCERERARVHTWHMQDSHYFRMKFQGEKYEVKLRERRTYGITVTCDTMISMRLYRVLWKWKTKSWSRGERETWDKNTTLNMCPNLNLHLTKHTYTK